MYQMPQIVDVPHILINLVDFYELNQVWSQRKMDHITLIPENRATHKGLNSPPVHTLTWTYIL